MTSTRHLPGLALATLLLAGCYESDFPLDATPQLPVDAAALGTWRCLPVDADADEPAATMTIAKNGERRYAVTWQEPGKAADRYDSYASQVPGARLLNIYDSGESNKDKKKWVYGRYALLRPHVLQLQIVDEKAMAGVEKTPQAVRRALERVAKEPKMLVDFTVCVRAKPAK
jgi:hypothetical protein